MAEYDKLEAGIDHVDIVYVTRTQEERFPSQEEADRYREQALAAFFAFVEGTGDIDF